MLLVTNENMGLCLYMPISSVRLLLKVQIQTGGKKMTKIKFKLKQSKKLPQNFWQ